MKKLLLAVLGGTAVASLAFASAASLTVDAGVLQAGVNADLACDDNGVKVNWGLETDDNSVYFADVIGIDEECMGADIVLRTNLMEDPLAGTITGDTHRFTFSPIQDATALTAVRVWIGK